MKPGNAMPLDAMPVGTIVHNIEMKPGKGGQIARSAGTYAQFVGRDQGYAHPAPELGRAARSCTADAWRRSARCPIPTTRTSTIGKAGRNRWLGKRPHVRGVAMNPVDHPHGGGEGRTSGGRHPVTPVGQADQGQEDPHATRDDKFILRSRHVAQEAVRQTHGSFGLERPVRRRLSAQEGGEGARRPAATR